MQTLTLCCADFYPLNCCISCHEEHAKGAALVTVLGPEGSLTDADVCCEVAAGLDRHDLREWDIAEYQRGERLNRRAE